MVNKNNKKFKIKTQYGFELFSGIQKTKKTEWMILHFIDRTIEVTKNHKLMTIDGWKECGSFQIGDSIKTDLFFEEIIKIENFVSDKEFYDILETESNEFIVNGLVSHNCSFMGSTGTLIPMKVLETLQWMNPIQEDEFMLVYDHYDTNRKYITVADPSEGLGQDYSVATVIDVTEYPYKISAKYRNNNISPLLFPHTIMNICMSYGSCPALVESNNACGGQVTYILYHELEYENVVLTSNSEKSIGGLREGGKSNQALPGVRTTKKVKSIGCSNLKTLMENEYLVIEDRDTIEELGTFIAKGTSYEADDECHDDTIMPLVLFSWFVKSEHFAEYCGNDIGIDLYQRNLDRAMESVMPFGVIHNKSIENPETITHNHYSNGAFFDVTENKSKSFAQWMLE